MSAKHEIRDPSDDLVRRTLKTVGILVGSCVLFVGTLSLLAVGVTSKAFGPSASPSAAELRPEAKDAKDAKKPTSI